MYPNYCSFHPQLGMTGMVVAVDPTAVGPGDVLDAIHRAPGSASAAAHAHAPDIDA